MNVKPKFAITHAPGCMLITDTKNISPEVLATLNLLNARSV